MADIPLIGGPDGGKKIDREMARGKKRVSGAATAGIFDGILADGEREEIREQLREMLERVDEQGKIFSRFPTPENLENYKGSIADYLKKSLPELLRLSEIQGAVLAGGRQKVYLKIEKIENSLRDFTEDFLSREKDKMDLVRRMDEIRGLIVDLYS